LIVELSPHAPVIRTDHILITSTEWQEIMFTPSRSDIEFVTGRNTYIALAQVTNLGTAHFTGTAYGKFELMNKAHAIPLTHKSRREIRTLFQKHPFSHEILSLSVPDSPSLSNYPYLTVNQLCIDKEAKVQVSDLDFADTIMDKEPTYYGEAVIEPEIIEAKGLELPTRVYANAAEAVNLKAFSEEIQPFAKEIFIDT